MNQFQNFKNELNYENQLVDQTRKHLHQSMSHYALGAVRSINCIPVSGVDRTPSVIPLNNTLMATSSSLPFLQSWDESNVAGASPERLFMRKGLSMPIFAVPKRNVTSQLVPYQR